MVDFSCVTQESVLKAEVARTGESCDPRGAAPAVAAAGQTGELLPVSVASVPDLCPCSSLSPVYRNP